jgi:hypothetical protein
MGRAEESWAEWAIADASGDGDEGVAMAEDAGGEGQREVGGVDEGVACGEADLAAVGVSGEHELGAEVGGGIDVAGVVAEEEAKGFGGVVAVGGEGGFIESKGDAVGGLVLAGVEA